MNLTFESDSEVRAQVDTYAAQVRYAVSQEFQIDELLDSCVSVDQVWDALDTAKHRLYSVVSTVQVVPVHGNVVTWTAVVAEVLLSVCKLRVLLEDAVLKYGSSAERIRLKMGQVYVDTNEFVLRCVSDRIYGERAVAIAREHAAFALELSRMLVNVFEVSEYNLAVDCGSISNYQLLLKQGTGITANLFEGVLERPWKGQCLGLVFGTLVRCLKAIYTTGNSKTLETLLTVISPTLVSEIRKFAKVEYRDIVDYYKYVAFNFVWLAVEDLSCIDDDYTHQADIYFNCLLALPSSDYSVIPSLEKQPSNGLEANSYDPRIRRLYQEQVSSEREIDCDQVMMRYNERHEISLMFVLNSMLMVQRLEEAVSVPPLLVEEMEVFSKSLADHLTSSIRKQSTSGLNSAPRVRALKGGSTATPVPELHEASKFQCLSSIITNGSYKARHIAVLKWLQHLKRGKLNTLINIFSINESNPTSFSTLVQSCDPSKYPGVHHFYQVLITVSRLFELLKLKFFVASTGSSVIGESDLQRLISDTSDLHAILKVKKLLDCKLQVREGQNLYCFSLVQSDKREQNTVESHQTELVRSINELEEQIDNDLFEPSW
ncbi:hypothetical protein PSN45_002215 [Yamadazyma tenuis]|uniref:Uncharacterized protein n=1 Tax=Candida tenuis (strain ATCC 10573 / BCRC 21748 / CBS 615 / JCM 9827 / NBRC 10315 / NRRL Y-1498 / VKM Y-70) TaxID=590646 RepID=G3BFM0_CANTC|nr:uncharacterized protein CANTEDRAFT_95516 [Yamadazyma tenuis ATCC 10573]EGV60051.1 hypothetical protein CANTEDRAFT_95516 [Yamadazyma tenuis ATCC 10573]WEJ94721.1 hypothetical protein PSN45_002215 [Yamadazyma tenuis]